MQLVTAPTVARFLRSCLAPSLPATWRSVLRISRCRPPSLHSGARLPPASRDNIDGGHSARARRLQAEASCYSIFFFASRWSASYATRMPKLHLSSSLPNQVTGGLLIVTAKSGVTLAQKPNNNRPHQAGASVQRLSGGSVVYAQMDIVVMSLDAQYSTLTNQADWEQLEQSNSGTFAPSVNCKLAPSGKLFFRQWNFNRRMIHLPVITTVPDTGRQCLGFQGIAGMDVNSATGDYGVTITNTASPALLAFPLAGFGVFGPHVDLPTAPNFGAIYNQHTPLGQQFYAGGPSATWVQIMEPDGFPGAPWNGWDGWSFS